MRIWVDDVRLPPDDDWMWVRTSDHAISILKTVSEWHTNLIQVMSLDHDLGILPYSGKEDTTRPIVLWMCENNFWPNKVVCHSQNPVGRYWIESMVERYKK